MGFSRQAYWSGLPFPSPGESSQPGGPTRVSCIDMWLLHCCRSSLSTLLNQTREVCCSPILAPQRLRGLRAALWSGSPPFPGNSRQHRASAPRGASFRCSCACCVIIVSYSPSNSLVPDACESIKKHYFKLRLNSHDEKTHSFEGFSSANVSTFTKLYNHHRYLIARFLHPPPISPSPCCYFQSLVFDG